LKRHTEVQEFAEYREIQRLTK